MRLIKDKKNNSNDYEILKNEILEIIGNTEFKFDSLLIDNNRFGNIIITISTPCSSVRFIDDRGDIYTEKKLSGTVDWKSVILTKKTGNSTNTPHSKLLSAIKTFVNH